MDRAEELKQLLRPQMYSVYDSGAHSQGLAVADTSMLYMDWIEVVQSALTNYVSGICEPDLLLIRHRLLFLQPSQ